MGDPGLPADLEGVGAAGGEDEDADRLAVVNAVVAAEIGADPGGVQAVVAGQDAVECTGEGFAGERHPAGEAPFAAEVIGVAPAEQDAVIEGDGGRDGELVTAFGEGGRRRGRAAGNR